jgi:hypothetical protein
MTKEAIRSAFLWDKLEKDVLDRWESLSLVEVKAALLGLIVMAVKGFDSVEHVEELMRNAWKENVDMAHPRLPDEAMKMFALEALRGRVFPLIFLGPGPAASALIGLAVVLRTGGDVEELVGVLKSTWAMGAVDALILEVEKRYETV